MNQRSRQKATSTIEEDFFKLLNNSNFGIDCRNNIDNCIIEPLYDDISEISYIRKCTSIYNNDDFKDFFSPVNMREELIQTFQQKIMLLDKNDPTYEVRKQHYEDQMEEKLNAIDSFEKAKNKRKRKPHHNDKKLKTILTSRFMSGKLLIFAKLSLKGFVYELMVIFYFPSEKTKQIFNECKIEKN